MMEFAHSVFWSCTAAAALFSTWLGFTADLLNRSWLWFFFSIIFLCGFFFPLFFFLREETVVSQNYGNAAQIYNYQGRKVPWASQPSCIWHHLISLALLLWIFLTRNSSCFFCDEFVWSLLFVYLFELLAIIYVLFHFGFFFKWRKMSKMNISFKKNIFVKFNVHVTRWGPLISP